MSNPRFALDVLNKDDLIVVTGTGGFIAGALVRDFHEQGLTHIRAIDKKPLPEWYQRVPGVESLSMDLSYRDNGVPGTWDGGREKAPAALSRKVIEAQDTYAVNEDGDKPEKRVFCKEHGLEYVVLRHTPKEGLPQRSSTNLRGF